MARATDPKRTGDQLFPGKQFLKALLAMQMPGYQVMPCELCHRAFAKLTMVGLGREFQHRGEIIEPVSDATDRLTV